MYGGCVKHNFKGYVPILHKKKPTAGEAEDVPFPFVPNQVSWSFFKFLDFREMIRFLADSK